MSTISAGTTTGTALVNTGDTSGNLVLQTNGTTTALTLGTDQSATFVGAIKNPTSLSVGLSAVPSNTTAVVVGAQVGGVTSTTTTINCSANNYFTYTATGINTWTFGTVPATNYAYGFVLQLTNGGLGAQTWPAAVKWPGGTAPTLTSSGKDLLIFTTSDGGTTWRGASLLNYSA